MTICGRVERDLAYPNIDGVGGVYVKGRYVGAYIGLIGCKDKMWGDSDEISRHMTDDLVLSLIS